MKKTLFLCAILAAFLVSACDTAQKKDTSPKEEKADPVLKDTLVDHKEFYEDGTLKGEGKALYKIIMNKPKRIKQGKWTLYYKEPKKILMSEGEYKDDIQNGKWTFYYKDGKKREEGNYDNGAITGEWINYYPTGEMSWKGTFTVVDKKDDATGVMKKTGVLEGKKVSYYKSGSVLKEEEFHAGILNGRTHEYYENGKPKVILMFKDAKKNGAINEWWDTGKHKTEGTFIEDKQTGKWKMYFNNGQTALEGTFSEGKLEGLWKFYSREGLLMKEGNYKAAKESGLWSFFSYDNGKKSLAMELALSGGMVDSQNSCKVYDKGIISGEGFLSGIPKGIFQVYKNNSPAETIEGQNAPDDDPAKGIVIKWTGKWKPLKRNGAWTEYYPGSKNKKFEADYLMDKKNGAFKEFYPNGKVKAEGKYLNDKMNETWKFYNENGSLDESKSGLYMLDKKRG